MSIQKTESRVTLSLWDIKDTPAHPEGICIVVDVNEGDISYSVDFTFSLDELSSLLRVERAMVQPEPVEVLRLRGARS